MSFYCRQQADPAPDVQNLSEDMVGHKLAILQQLEQNQFIKAAEKEQTRKDERNLTVLTAAGGIGRCI
jgi:hypothetical protein